MSRINLTRGRTPGRASPPHRRAAALRRAALATAAALALAAVALAAGCDAPGGAGRYTGIELTPAKAKPAFTLTATDGRAYDFRRETDGHLTLLFFGYTHCPDVCPVQLTNIAAAMERLSAEQRAAIRVVFVTTDPARDSLPQLRSWLDNFNAHFIGLRGPRDSISAIEASVGLAPSVIESGGADYGVGHAAQVLAFTPDDSLRVLYGFGVRQQDWVHDLPRLMAVRPAR